MPPNCSIPKAGMQQQGVGIIGATKQVTKSRNGPQSCWRDRFQRLIDLKWTNTILSGNFIYVLKYIFSYSIMNVDEAVQYSFVQ
jgi:hypothetical protein